jgi:ubiquinone/menaquinone biosynthesis C-methylase UbiE
MQQNVVDRKNAIFWNELCGSGLARLIGMTKITPESIRAYDKAYLDLYPYLERYVTSQNLKGKRVLEVGLGFGTLGQLIDSMGCEYYGLDIAEGPVAMMKDRLKMAGKQTEGRVRLGSALNIPFEDGYFDYVYSIGCLHHTGNLSACVKELFRVLRHTGKAIVMLYNRHSFRQLVHVPIMHFWNSFLKRDFDELVRSLYDTDSKGKSAPFTEFVSRSQVHQLFSKFNSVNIECQNFDDYGKLRLIGLSRMNLLSNVGRILGLDLYITAEK